MTSSSPPTIDYYVWLMSDWAYLGGVRLIQLAARHGLAVNHIPMRMQDVYAASGGILLRDRSWQRQAYRIHELKRWSARLGIPVNIEPHFFPVDIDQASRMVIAAQQIGLPVADFVNAIMRAIWAEDRNVADPDVLRDVADGLNLPGAELCAAGRCRKCPQRISRQHGAALQPACSDRPSTSSRAKCFGVRIARHARGRDRPGAWRPSRAALTHLLSCGRDGRVLAADLAAAGPAAQRSARDGGRRHSGRLSDRR